MRDALRTVRGGLPRLRPINKNAQKPAPPSSQKLHLDDLDAFRIGDPLGDFLDLSDNLFFSNDSSINVYCNKKVGFRPLVTFDNFIIHV